MNPIIEKLRKIIQEKQSNLALAADVDSAERVLEIAEEVGEKLCILKTHVDILPDFTPDFTKKLREIANKKNFLIFEDRKFADIGNTVSLQFAKGIYEIASWADIVNAHSIVGEGIVEGLKKVNKMSGLILLAQMTPKGNLFDEAYAMQTLEIAKKHSDFVMGFIGSADKPETLKKLREGSGADFLILTPGIKLQKGGDDLAQTYNTPEKAIENGSDIIIVGRGIYEAENPIEEAEKYRKAGFEATLNLQ